MIKIYRQNDGLHQQSSRLLRKGNAQFLNLQTVHYVQYNVTEAKHKLAFTTIFNHIQIIMTHIIVVYIGKSTNTEHKHTHDIHQHQCCVSVGGCLEI